MTAVCFSTREAEQIESDLNWFSSHGKNQFKSYDVRHQDQATCQVRAKILSKTVNTRTLLTELCISIKNNKKKTDSYCVVTMGLIAKVIHVIFFLENCKKDNKESSVAGS